LVIKDLFEREGYVKLVKIWVKDKVLEELICENPV
jgi:patatin-like phospholipase/acyl hydrolase